MTNISTVSFCESFRIGVEDLNYKPFFYIEKGEYKGISRELLDTFAKKYNHSFEYIPIPVARLLPAFLNGEIDFKYPANINWKNDGRRFGQLPHSCHRSFL